MNPNSVRPRRLHVSALAAVANPSYTRLDTWNLLDDACRHLAEVDLAGLDTTHDVARAKRLMDRIGAYERYWLYPGHRIWRLSALIWIVIPRCGLPRKCRWPYDCCPNTATAQRCSTPPRHWRSRSW